MGLQGGSSVADGAQSGRVGEYRVEVVNWIVVDLWGCQHDCEGGIGKLGLPASRGDGAADTPFMLSRQTSANDQMKRC